MKFLIPLPFILCCFLLSPATLAEEMIEGPSAWKVDFESSPLGVYPESQLRMDWDPVDWAEGLNRTRIVLDASHKHHQTLEVTYPKGSVGPRVGGAQFVIPLQPEEQYTLSYDFRVSEDFDFRLGGKLPGLTSGGSQYTGGTKPLEGQGWSARFMWREKGQMVLYLYSIDMKGQWGDDLPLEMPALERGKWYRVTQRITLNAPDAKDGHIEVWVDDELVLDLPNIRLRIGNKGLIDSFYFSTFFGGNTPEWGPHNHCHIRFDNFEVNQ